MMVSPDIITMIVMIDMFTMVVVLNLSLIPVLSMMDLMLIIYWVLLLVNLITSFIQYVERWILSFKLSPQVQAKIHSN